MARVSPITQRILDHEPTLQVHNEGEWSGTQSLYTAFNDAGVECEVGEFLYSITRLLKPQYVLETGTHWGISASYIGFALQDNECGRLQTFEFLEPNYKEAMRIVNNLRLLVPTNKAGTVDIELRDVQSFTPTVKYQLMFLDTEPQTRFAELERFYPYLDEGGFVFIHDLHRHMHQISNSEHGFAWPYGRIPKEMHHLIRTGKLRPFHFPTPRGFTGFYKEHQGDHYYRIYE